MKKKTIIIIAALIMMIGLITVCVLTTPLLFRIPGNLISRASQFPSSGLYYCEGIDVYFDASLDEQGCRHLVIRDSTEIAIGTRSFNYMFGWLELAPEQIVMNGTYYWKQKNDVVIMQFSEFPYEDMTGQWHQFERIGVK